MSTTTIQDVAKAAGVSAMTVSRVINNKGYVKEKTREMVIEAINELDFKPNRIAKSLVTKKSQAIAFVVVNISDPFYNQIGQGIESICYENGYTVMICDTHSPRREKDYLNMLGEHRVDGVILHHLAVDQDQIMKLEYSGIKCVLIDNEDDLPNVCSVDNDNYLGGILAAEHLVEKGHTNIGCLMGTLQPRQDKNVPYEDTFQYRIWQKRTAGFKAGLSAHNIKKCSFFQCNGLFDEAELFIKEALEKIDMMEEKPTAIYCENDIMAVALLSAVQKRGLKVPDDIAIIGHDGIELCRMVYPNITTIAQPCYDIGQLAAKTLIERINGNDEIKKAVLNPTLQLGETT